MCKGGRHSRRRGTGETHVSIVTPSADSRRGAGGAGPAPQPVSAPRIWLAGPPGARRSAWPWPKWGPRRLRVPGTGAPGARRRASPRECAWAPAPCDCGGPGSRLRRSPGRQAREAAPVRPRCPVPAMARLRWHGAQQGGVGLRAPTSLPQGVRSLEPGSSGLPRKLRWPAPRAVPARERQAPTPGAPAARGSCPRVEASGPASQGPACTRPPPRRAGLCPPRPGHQGKS